MNEPANEARLFEMPADPADKLRPVLRYHEKALEKAEARLEAAADKVTYEREQLERLEAAIAQILLAKRNAGRPGIMDEVADLVNAGAMDTDGMTVTATVHPITGEVSGG